MNPNTTQYKPQHTNFNLSEVLVWPSEWTKTIIKHEKFKIAKNVIVELKIICLNRKYFFQFDIYRHRSFSLYFVYVK